MKQKSIDKTNQLDVLQKTLQFTRNSFSPVKSNGTKQNSFNKKEDQKTALAQQIKDSYEQLKLRRKRNINVLEQNEKMSLEHQQSIATKNYLLMQVAQQLEAKANHQQHSSPLLSVKAHQQNQQALQMSREHPSLYNNGRLITDPDLQETMLNVPSSRLSPTNKVNNSQIVTDHIPSLYQNLITTDLIQARDDAIYEKKVLKSQQERMAEERLKIVSENTQLQKRVKMYQEMIREVRVASNSMEESQVMEANLLNTMHESFSL